MKRFRRPPIRCLLLSTGLGLFLAASSESARAQFNGDPFDPFRAAYRSSSLPSYNQMMPGQSRTVTPPGMGTVPGIGQPWDTTFSPRLEVPAVGRFDRLEEDLFGSLDSVYRQYDADFGRVYRPNAEADEQFAQAQEMRRELYLQATRETDPQKRAELIQEYRTLSRRISLGMSPSASRNALNARAEQEEASGNRRGAQQGSGRLPATVRSYEDLIQWSRLINQDALGVGVVRPEAN